MPKKSAPAASTIICHVGLRITPDTAGLFVTTNQTVTKFHQLPLPADTLTNGHITNPAALSEILTQLLKQVSPPGKYVVLGVPEHLAFTKSFSFPKLSIPEIRDAVVWEAEHYLPLPLDQMYLDWCLLPQSEHDVQVLAVPKSAIDAYIDLVKKLGKIPFALETNSLTLARLAGPVTQTTLVIDADTTSTLAVIEPTQAIALTAVSRATSAGKLDSELANTISELCQYYESKYHQPLQKILYTGPLQSQLTSLLPKAITSQPIALAAALKPELAIGFSLAQKPVAPPEEITTINVIPTQTPESYDQVASSHLKRQFFLTSIICLVIINCICGVFLFLLLSRQSSLGADNNQLSGGGLELTQVSAVNKQTAAVLQIAGQRQTFGATFSQIISSLPAELTITRIKLDAATSIVTIDGHAPTRDQVLALKQTLEKTPGFSQVRLPLSVLEKDLDLDFSLSAQWSQPK